MDGGFCDYLAVPEANLIAVDDLSADHAAMVEFLAIGAHGLRRAGPREGDRVLVVGAGPIGMAAMVFATLRGGRVTVFDLRADWLAVCRDRLGAEATVEAGPGVEEELRRITEGDFYDLVIEATGHGGSMERSLGYVAHGGTYLLLGIVLALPGHFKG
jgi:threonine dehydrogenase-like Zn-dependent dehydrogenase